MQIIASHMNTDFDALASMLAAKKLHPNAQLVISSRQHSSVRRFLNIYRDTFNYVQDNEIDWSKVSELILVDVATLSRVSPFTKDLPSEGVKMTVYDHHPANESNVKRDAGKVEQVGAAVTLLVEEIQANNIPITSFEATLFGLGIYTDTGFFTYNHTSPRDLKVASYLMEQGMNLDLVDKFSEQRLEPEQQELLDRLFVDTTTYEKDGLQIAMGTIECPKIYGGLALVTEKLLDIKGTDAVIVVVSMKNHVIIVGRANSGRVTLLPLLKKWGGGGHKHAGSATLKNIAREHVWEEVKGNIHLIIKPATTAGEMMNAPVRTISPETTIEEAGVLMYRYEHSGYPVIENGSILGIITRRDLDKAIHHGLGHAPVKAYMSTNVITSTTSATLEEIQNLVIEHNIGRIPIVENHEIVGIISRTDIIRALHEKALMEDLGEIPYRNHENNIRVAMKQQLDKHAFSLLQKIGKVADKAKVKAYLIGGIVRDVLLNVVNDDIDIVVEGDGIAFAESLQKAYSGEVIAHENFGTATWTHPSGSEIDIASSRLEYYNRPASLPDVELSTLEEDLYRRDFTINAMAVCLNNDRFGMLVDPFAGRLDIFNKRVRVLHNLSFVEDPTRIFRAIRFELRFEFKMDDQTEQLALHSIAKVVDLSIDRIIAEMKRLFAEHYPTLVIRRLFELDFWEQLGVQKEKIQPSNAHARRLQNLYQEHKELGLKQTNPDWLENFVIPLFHESDPETMEKFAVTKSDLTYVKEIVRLREQPLFAKKDIGDLHEVLRHYTVEAIVFLVASEPEKNGRVIMDYLRKRKVLTTYIKGKDLRGLGLMPGPHFSEIFLGLEIAVLRGEISTKDQAIEWVKENYI